MFYEAELDTLKYEYKQKMPSLKRRTRGPKPRGPKPQVCDLCQVRKVKCNKERPQCFLCKKLDKPCTYERSGFEEAVDTSSKSTVAKVINKYGKKYIMGGTESVFVNTSLRNSFYRMNNFKVFMHKDGLISYSGPSMATYYYTVSSHLLKSISEIPSNEYKPMIYNKNIQVDITRTIILQLVELYFGNLNSFYPLLDPVSFYTELNKREYTDEFQALLSVVCLSGASYYPVTLFGRIIAASFAKYVEKTFKKIYLKPSITAIQACLLASYHIALCDENCMVANGWFYLGLAKAMLSTLGGPRFYKKASYKYKETVRRIWWIIYAVEVVTSHICGRIFYETEVIKLPAKGSKIASVNFVFADVFLVKELMNLNSKENAIYFHEFCNHLKLIGRWATIREKSKFKSFMLKSRSKYSLDSILNDYKQSFLEDIKELERACINWYISLPFSPDETMLVLPPEDDIHNSNLAIMNFSLLMDINKRLIDLKQSPLCQPFSNSISLRLLNTYSNLDKCIVYALFGAKCVYNLDTKITKVGIPYLWYGMLEFFFFFIYIIKVCDPNHWCVKPSKFYAKYIWDQFEIHSDRWVIIRDAYLTIKSSLKDPKSMFDN